MKINLTESMPSWFSFNFESEGVEYSVRNQTEFPESYTNKMGITHRGNIPISIDRFCTDSIFRRFFCSWFSPAVRIFLVRAIINHCYQPQYEQGLLDTCRELISNAKWISLSTDLKLVLGKALSLNFNVKFTHKAEWSKVIIACQKIAWVDLEDNDPTEEFRSLHSMISKSRVTKSEVQLLALPSNYREWTRLSSGLDALIKLAKVVVADELTTPLVKDSLIDYFSDNKERVEIKIKSLGVNEVAAHTLDDFILTLMDAGRKTTISTPAQKLAMCCLLRGNYVAREKQPKI